MKIGFIDYYLDEWHANNYPARIKALTDGEIEVAYAYAETDSPKGGLTTDEWCEKYGVQRVDNIEDLVALSDGIIVLAPDDCDRHEALCQAALASGKPCFVDKTFAPDKASALRMVDLAKKNGTPFFSSSALRYSTEYQNINTDEITAISACGTVKGPKLGLDIYSVHLIEPVLMLMKATPSRLMITPSRYEDFTLTLLFDDGRIANICGFTGKTKYTMNISARDENKSLTVASDFFGEFYKVLVEFFKTHTLPFPTEETIAVMAVREAAIKALDTPNTWVEI